MRSKRLIATLLISVLAISSAFYLIESVSADPATGWWFGQSHITFSTNHDLGTVYIGVGGDLQYHNLDVPYFSQAEGGSMWSRSFWGMVYSVQCSFTQESPIYGYTNGVLTSICYQVIVTISQGSNICELNVAYTIHIDLTTSCSYVYINNTLKATPSLTNEDPSATQGADYSYLASMSIEQ